MFYGIDIFVMAESRGFDKVVLAKYFALDILWYLYICDEKHIYLRYKGLVNIEYILKIGHMNGSLYVRSLKV